jgi:hypothetical protein
MARFLLRKSHKEFTTMKTSFKMLLPMALATAVALFAAVRTDYDHKADFSRYHTYSWIGVNAGNSIWQDRIMSSVDAALSAKGWTKVQSGGDATVSAFGRTTQQNTLETFYTGYPGWGWRAAWWGMGPGMTATTEVIPERIGNLTVDVFDGNTKQLIWRGEASDAVSDKPEKNEKKMEKAVDEMFKKFPPASKG